MYRRNSSAHVAFYLDSLILAFYHNSLLLLPLPATARAAFFSRHFELTFDRGRVQVNILEGPSVELFIREREQGVHTVH
jgi:hypothetical protein